jgi:hypothetical protein
LQSSGYLLFSREPALLGLEYEAVLFVEVNTLQGAAAVSSHLSDDALEDIAIILRGSRRGIWMRNLKEVAQLYQKQTIIGSFLPTFLILPPSDK